MGADEPAETDASIGDESMSGTRDMAGNERTDAGRNTPQKRVLRAVAAQAAVLSAAVHLLWAWPRLPAASDLRPYVFVLGGIVTVMIAAATLRGGEYRRLYALGAGTLSGFLSGFIGWHGAEALAVLTADPFAIVAKAAEGVGIIAFLALYRLAPPTQVVVERQRATDSVSTQQEGLDP